MTHKHTIDFVHFLTDFITHIKMYHWTSRKEHVHTALGELYKNMDIIVDDIVEGLIAYQPDQYAGTTTQKRNTSSFNFQIDVNVKDQVELYLTMQSHTIIEWIHVWDKTHPHIEHMLKDILAHVSKTLYQVRLSKM